MSCSFRIFQHCTTTNFKFCRSQLAFSYYCLCDGRCCCDCFRTNITTYKQRYTFLKYCLTEYGTTLIRCSSLCVLDTCANNIHAGHTIQSNLTGNCNFSTCTCCLCNCTNAPKYWWSNNTYSNHCSSFDRFLSCLLYNPFKTLSF